MNRLTRRQRFGRWLPWRAVITIVMAALTVALAQADGTNEALAAGGGPEMAISVREGGACSGSDCYARAGESFYVGVDAVEAPDEYVAVQVYMDFGGTFNWNGEEDGAGPGSCSDGVENQEVFLDGHDYRDADCTTVAIPYVPQAVGDEITWPDAEPVTELRNHFTNSLGSWGALSTFALPDLVRSSFEGEILHVEFACPATAAQQTLTLHPYGAVFINTQGSVFVDFNEVKYIPKTDALTVHCVEATAGDYDGDGCDDATENGADPALGGGRNFVNPWDFYDVAGPGGPSTPDGVVDMPNDYMQVLAHYAPTGYPPGQGYEHYDRGPALGGNSWTDTQPPDGVIDLPNDLLGLIQQVGHSCA